MSAKVFLRKYIAKLLLHDVERRATGTGKYGFLEGIVACCATLLNTELS